MWHTWGWGPRVGEKEGDWQAAHTLWPYPRQGLTPHSPATPVAAILSISQQRADVYDAAWPGSG